MIVVAFLLYVHDVFSETLNNLIFPGATKYTDKDNGGMLVWSPYHSIPDAKCKFCIIHYTIFWEFSWIRRTSYVKHIILMLQHVNSFLIGINVKPMCRS